MARTSSTSSRALRLLLVLALLVVVLVAGVYLLQKRGYRLDDALTTVVEKSTDAATAANVKTALALSRRVSAFDIDVDAEDGSISLRGRVPSEEVKGLAGSIVADTTGVREVRNLLQVDPQVSPDPEVARLVARVEELELQTTLLEAMRSDPALREVQPEVDSGTVTLLGAVDSDQSRELARQIVQGLATAHRVDDRLSLRATKAAVDAAGERVEFALYSSGAFDLGRIEIVERNGGEIALQGTVRSRAEQLLAEHLARDVAGIENVVNELQVRSDTQVTADRGEPAAAPGR